MSIPAKPQRFEKEGPTSPCTLGGVDLKWKNCSCLSCAMGMNKSSYGRIDMSGCAVRSATNDHSGGTTIPQMQAVCSAHGVATDAHTGGDVASLFYLSYQCHNGRGFCLQGNTEPDGRGNVNHMVWVNNTVGGTAGDPDGFMVWDPWSDGEAYWSYAKLKAFMLALHPYGEGDSRTLKSMGVNGGYALVFPDTEPHVHLHYGGHRSSPFPDGLRAKSPTAGHRVNVRTRPDRVVASDVAGTLADNARWTAYQKTVTGVRLAGSSTWYGNHNGDRWVHSSGVTGAGA